MKAKSKRKLALLKFFKKIIVPSFCSSILITLPVIPAGCLAEPIRADGDILPGSLLPTYNYPSENLTILGIEVGSGISIQSLLKKLGKTDLIRSTAKHDPDMLCYSSSIDSTGLVFESEHGRISGFTLYRDAKDFEKAEYCTKSDLVDSNLTVDNGLSLDLSQVEARVLVMPTILDSESTKMIWHFKKPFTKEEIEEAGFRIRRRGVAYWDVAVITEINFNNQKKLSRIRIHKSTVY